MGVLTKRGKRVYVPELFEEIGKTNSQKKRKELIEEYVSLGEQHKKVLRAIVQTLFHPDVEWDLPPGEVPMKKPNTYEKWSTAPSNLFKEAKMFQYFIKGGNNLLKNQLKRERIFINICENVHKQEAELLQMMKDKKCTYKGVTKNLFQSVYPEWFPVEEEVKEEKKEGNSEKK